MPNESYGFFLYSQSKIRFQKIPGGNLRNWVLSSPRTYQWFRNENAFVWGDGAGFILPAIRPFPAQSWYLHRH